MGTMHRSMANLRLTNPSMKDAPMSRGGNIVHDTKVDTHVYISQLEIWHSFTHDVDKAGRGSFEKMYWMVA